MKRFSPNFLRLGTRSTIPPSCNSHALGNAAQHQTSPQEQEFTNAHEIPGPPDRSTTENDLTYLDDRDQPPSESLAERSGTIKYLFSPIGTNAMGLLPSASAEKSQPKYYITVSLNCFMPSSHITTLYRGADENAPRVCDFEMGIIDAANSRLRMQTYTPDPIKLLLRPVAHQNARWTWKLPNDTSCILLWDCSMVPFTCTAILANQAPSQPVARFTSHIQSLPSDPRHSAPGLSMLEVLPAGRKRFDDILISLLILERIRLTPDPKSLFNYYY